MKRHKACLSTIIALLFSCIAYGQFNDSGTGNLQSPSAEFGKDGTFAITNLYLNKHSLAPTGWDCGTFAYGFNLSLFERLEITYMCTIFDGRFNSQVTPIMRNQDRHFAVKIGLIKEGQLWRYMPAIAIGVSDPFSGSYGGYFNEGLREDLNGYFNRAYIVMTRHFSTEIGQIGMHVGYQMNGRKDYRIKAPCFAFSWYPIWLQSDFIQPKFIAEYDSRTFNVGAIATMWKKRIEVMFDLQAMRWISFGLKYNVSIKS